MLTCPPAPWTRSGEVLTLFVERPLRVLLASLPALAALGVTAGPGEAGSPAKKVDFTREVRPIFSDKCFACHGPDSKRRKGKLRFDTREGAFREKDPVIVPGKPEESEILNRLASTDAKRHMPPASTGKTLTGEEIETVRRWVAEGAEWKEHWAYRAPAR